MTKREIKTLLSSMKEHTAGKPGYSVRGFIHGWTFEATRSLRDRNGYGSYACIFEAWSPGTSVDADYSALGGFTNVDNLATQVIRLDSRARESVCINCEAIGHFNCCSQCGKHLAVRVAQCSNECTRAQDYQDRHSSDTEGNDR